MKKILLLIATVISINIATAKTSMAEIATEKTEPQYTQISLSETATAMIEQDEIIISLRAETKNKDPKKVQNDLNEIMNDALKTSKEFHKDIDVKTNSYNVYERREHIIDQNHNMNQNKPKFYTYYVATQNIILKSKNFEKALELTGLLQEKGLMSNNISFTVSYEKREEIKNQLIAEAISKIKETAQIVADNMQKQIKNYVELDINKNESSPPMPMMYRAEAMMAKSDGMMTAPVAEAGDENISVHIFAKIELK